MNKRKFLTIVSLTIVIGIVITGAFFLKKHRLVNDKIPLFGLMDDDIKRYYYQLYSTKDFDEFNDTYRDAIAAVKKKSEDSYFIFNLNVFLYCNLDSGKWLFFCGQLQRDKNKFWDNLVQFTRTKQFLSLPMDLQKRVAKFSDCYVEDHSYFNVY